MGLDTAYAHLGIYYVTEGEFKFTLTYGADRIPDGIHFDMATAKLDDSIFIATLNRLCAEFPCFLRFAELVHIKEHWMRSVKNFERKDFARAWKLCNQVAKQESWVMNPAYLDALRSKIDKAMVRKFGIKSRLVKPKKSEVSYRRVKGGTELKEWKNHYGHHKPGYVYIMRFMTDPVYYKIGCSAYPQNRKQYFEINFPFEIHIEHLIKTDNMRELETDLHRKFRSKKRGKSEFYHLTDEELAWIKNTYPQAEG